MPHDWRDADALEPVGIDVKRVLWHPRYWPLWLGFGLLRLLALLPYRVLYHLGKRVGGLMRHLASGRAKIAARNLELCYPELDADARDRLLARHFESLGIGLFEIPFAWWASDKQLVALADVSGLENLHNASAEGKGVLVLMAHFTCMEITGRQMSLCASGDVVYRKSENPVVEYMFARRRGAISGRAIPRENVKLLLRRLRDGHAVWYAPDQNTQRKKAVFVKFFGHYASTTPATHKLAKLTGARVVPVMTVRKADASGYRLVIEPPLEDFPTDDVIIDTQRVNDIIERWVRDYPEQYLWIHRRFRSRPPSEPQKIYG